MAVTARQSPDFRTISDFRKRHLSALDGLFTQVLRLCQQAGLVSLGHVALDGTKIRANASKHKAMSYRRMQTAEPALAAEVARWLTEATVRCARGRGVWSRPARGRAAGVGDEQTAPRGEDSRRESRLGSRGSGCHRGPAAEGRDPIGSPSTRPPGEESPGTPPARAQRNFTDPDSRIMKTQDGFIQGYNAQAAVDAEHQVIVAQGLTNQASDAHQLEPMLTHIRRNTGRQARELSADAGYCSEHNLTALARRHVRGYIATGRHQHGAAAAVGRRESTR
jgi:hypothetical protein